MRVSVLAIVLWQPPSLLRARSVLVADPNVYQIPMVLVPVHQSSQIILEVSKLTADPTWHLILSLLSMQR